MHFSWEQRKLGDILISLQNNTLSRADLSNEAGVAKNVHYGDVLIKFGEVLDVSKEKLPMISDESVLSKYKLSFLQNGDVIVADTAEDSTVGKCSEIAGLNDEVVLSGLHTIPYRPIEKFASGYLGYYLNSSAYHNQLIPLMQGIKVTSISKSAMQDTDIVYPKSVEEQGKIGDYFQSLDHLITLHQRKQSCICLMCITKSWEQRKLEEVCSEIGDGLHSAPEYDDNGKSFFINGNNLINGHIVINSNETKRVSENTFEKNNKQLDDNTVLLSINGTIGNLAYYQGEPVMLGKSAAYLKANKIDKTFLYSLLQTTAVMNNFMLSLTGTTIKNLGLDAIKKTKISIPKLREQERIGLYFSQLDHLITLHQRKKNMYLKGYFRRKIMIGFDKEADFEQALITALQSNGWEKQVIQHPTEKQLIQNWADILFENNRDIDRLNDCPLVQEEMDELIEQIKRLRTPLALNSFINGKTVSITRKNPKDTLHYGKEVSLKIYDRMEIAAGQSRYQIVQQPLFPRHQKVLQDRRGDLMLLINGMPLFHIELKRSGIPVSEACNQIGKYAHEGVFTGLFSLIQVFVAMNPDETLYFANPGPDGKLNSDFFFHWADFNNEPINDWRKVASTILSIPMAHQLIGFYTVADDSDGILKVMRSYQYYAANKISDRVSKNDWTAGKKVQFVM